MVLMHSVAYVQKGYRQQPFQHLLLITRVICFKCLLEVWLISLSLENLCEVLFENFNS